MPFVDGLEATQPIKQQLPGTKVLVLTSLTALLVHATPCRSKTRRGELERALPPRRANPGVSAATR